MGEGVEKKKQGRRAVGGAATYWIMWCEEMWTQQLHSVPVHVQKSFGAGAVTFIMAAGAMGSEKRAVRTESIANARDLRRCPSRRLRTC